MNLPKIYSLEQNYPNPFNPVTEIKYGLPTDGVVSITLYNIVGQQVATILNEYKSAGYHSVTFNASGLESGVYFYRLSANEGKFIESKKMLLLK